MAETTPTFLIAVDGVSPETIVRAARDLGRDYAARIVIIWIVELVASLPGRYPERPLEDADIMVLRERVARLGELDVAVEVHRTSLGQPARIVASRASELDAAAVVALSGRGRRLWPAPRRLAEKLLAESPCPVLVVTPQTRPAWFT